MFNTICHQGNSNYDSNRILLHTHYFITLKTCHHKTLKTMWSNGNCHILLVGVQNVTRSLENSLVVFYKITSTPTLWPSNSTLMLASFLAVKVKVAQLCPTLWDPMDYTVHGILQARILEWVAFPFSRGSSQPRDQTQVSRVVGKFFYQLSHKGSPRTLECVAYPFCSGSSQPRNRTGVSCITGGFWWRRQ